MSAVGIQHQPEHESSRLNRAISLGAVVSGGVSIAGVAGFWFASAHQCGQKSSPTEYLSCPLSSAPFVFFLSLLTVGALLLAIASLAGKMGTLGSIAGAILLVGAIEFPLTVVFTDLAIVPGVIDLRYLILTLVISAGLVGLTASWWSRRTGAVTGRPFNRLSVGAAIIALTGWEAYWFPAQLGPTTAVAYDCPLGGCLVPPSYSPIVPEYVAIGLIGLGLLVIAPIVARGWTLVSFTGTALTLISAIYVGATTFWAPFNTNTGLVVAMFWVDLGCLVAVSGLVPEVWAVYLAPKYGPFWSPYGTLKSATELNKPG